MSNPLRLEMRGVRRSFGATKALRGVELSVVPGEVMALDSSLIGLFALLP